MSTVAERVAAGAAWLDVQMPNWWATHGIDLDAFDMAKDCRCVVGQLSPKRSFCTATAERWLDLDCDVAQRLGFFAGHTSPRASYAEYDALQAEWRRVITERRAAA